MNNDQNSISSQSNGESENKSDSNKISVKQIFTGIFGIIIAIYGTIPDAIESLLGKNLPDFYFGLFVVGAFIYFIYLFHKKTGVNRNNLQENKHILQITVILLIYIIVAFIPNPYFLKNWRGSTVTTTIMPTATFTATITPTPISTATVTQTLSPTPTVTSTLIPTPSPTYTPQNYAISVCVFDLGNDDNNEPIAKTNIEYLQTLGFNVKNVYINNKSSYEDCDVLYLSDGWVTIKDELQIVENMDNLKKKLEEPNAPGLLIGNPGKDYTPFHIDFYAPINYCKISSERVGELFPSDIRKNNAIKYSFLLDFIPTDDQKLDEEKRKKLPVPESVASIEQDYDKPYSFQYLVVGNQLKDITVKNQCDNHTVIGGLIASNESQNNPRYLIMPGGEFSSRYPISDDLFVLIIKWLAGISIK